MPIASLAADSIEESEIIAEIDCISECSQNSQTTILGSRGTSVVEQTDNFPTRVMAIDRLDHIKNITSVAGLSEDDEPVMHEQLRRIRVRAEIQPAAQAAPLADDVKRAGAITNMPASRR